MTLKEAFTEVLGQCHGSHSGWKCESCVDGVKLWPPWEEEWHLIVGYQDDWTIDMVWNTVAGALSRYQNFCCHRRGDEVRKMEVQNE